MCIDEAKQVPVAQRATAGVGQSSPNSHAHHPRRPAELRLDVFQDIQKPLWREGASRADGSVEERRLHPAGELPSDFSAEPHGSPHAARYRMIPARQNDRWNRSDLVGDIRGRGLIQGREARHFYPSVVQLAGIGGDVMTVEGDVRNDASPTRYYMSQAQRTCQRIKRENGGRA